MILVAIGKDRPFRRLVHGIERWTGKRSPKEILGTVSTVDWSIDPRSCRWMPILDRNEMQGRARILVGDASVENLLMAVSWPIPAVILPRSPIYGESRSDTQLRLAQRARSHAMIHIARDELAIADLLERLAQEGSGCVETCNPAAALFKRRLATALGDGGTNEH